MKFITNRKILPLIFISAGTLFAEDLLITPPSPLSTDENSTSAFSMVLANQPTEDVYVKCESSNNYEAVCPGTKKFTSSNWDTPQIFTISGVNDYQADGDKAYTLTFYYSNLIDLSTNFSSFESFNMTSVDINTEPTIVSKGSLTTSESGDTDSFSINLQQAPTADVTIAISSSDPTLGTVDKSSLTFTPANWDTAQTVTVSGMDDDGTIGGSGSYTLLIASAVSTDSYYNTFDTPDLAVTNLDNDSNTVNIVPQTIAQTNESGSSILLDISLNAKITSNTIVNISTDTTEASLSTNSMIFTSANWNIPQVLTLTGVEDNIIDGDIVYKVNFQSISFSYSSINITNIDSGNGVEPVLITATDTSLSEAGDTASFSVVLQTAPSTSISIPFAITQATQTTFSTSSPLVFTTTNWDTPQTVTISAVDDNDSEPTQNYTLEFPKLDNTENEYNKKRDSIILTNYDNDEASALDFIISITDQETSESGDNGSFGIKLNKAPTDDLKVFVSSSDTSEGIITSPASAYLYFSSDDWNSSKNVVIKGVDDQLVDGDLRYTVNLSAETSIGSDSGNSVLSLSKSVSMINYDNEKDDDDTPIEAPEEQNPIIVIDDAQIYDINSSIMPDGTIINSTIDNLVKLEMQQTTDGVVHAILDTNSSTATLSSEISDTKVHFFKDENSLPTIKTLIKTQDENNNSVDIEIITNHDASTSYKVGIEEISTELLVELPGADINVTADGTITTSYSTKPTECITSYTQVEIVTLIDGTTTTKFITLDCDGTILDTKETLLNQQQIPHGSSIIIKEDSDGMIIIELVMDLKEELNFKENGNV